MPVKCRFESELVGLETTSGALVLVMQTRMSVTPATLTDAALTLKPQPSDSVTIDMVTMEYLPTIILQACSDFRDLTDSDPHRGSKQEISACHPKTTCP